MSSLPSYIVNIDEFNEIFSSALSTNDGPSFKTFSFLYETKKVDCLQETFSVRTIFSPPENAIIYGIAFTESSFLFGNQIQLGKIFEREQVELGRAFIYDGYEGLAFNPPLRLRKNETLYLDYINDNCSKKTFAITLKFLLEREKL